MPNHVHFVISPQHKDSVALLFKKAHRRYTRRINFRKKWRGHLWQERFHSIVMDEKHLNASVRYFELNPVSANLCASPSDWRWSSVHAHPNSTDDELVSVKPLLAKFPDWAAYLADRQSSRMLPKVRQHSRTGRLLGSGNFIETLELISERSLKTLRPGPTAQNQLSKLSLDPKLSKLSPDPRPDPSPDPAPHKYP